MNVKKNILQLIILLILVSCTKKAPELIQLAQNSLDQNQEDDAIKKLNKLLDDFPKDSLASFAQYKLASIYKNWKNKYNLN